MSHELRTPLNSILPLSQLMISRRPGVDPAQDIEHLHVIERNGRHLLELINDILDLSKIEAGRTDMALIDFDPTQTLNRVQETMQPMAGEKGLALEVVAEANIPRMHSDESRIGQILLNLLGNAVKFTARGRITITLCATEQTVSFTVADTGIGIPETQLPHIFDEFRQVDGSTTRRHEMAYGLMLSGFFFCRELSRQWCFCNGV